MEYHGDEKYRHIVEMLAKEECDEQSGDISDNNSDREQ
jgi:hypothetical protein